MVDRAVVRGRIEIPPCGFTYVAFVDPSGGSSDSMTLCIAHREGERVVIDAIREAKAPFTPSAVVSEFAQLLRSYGISSVVGDRYAGEWTAEQFRKVGIEYQAAEKPKSELYLDLLPLLNSGMIDLLDHPRAIAQLCALERHTTRSGKDSVDHARGAHDDVANAIAGAAAWRPKPMEWAGAFEWAMSKLEASKRSATAPVVRAQIGVERPDGVPPDHVKLNLVGELQHRSHIYPMSGVCHAVRRDQDGAFVWMAQDDCRAMLGDYRCPQDMRNANANLHAELVRK